MKKKTKIILIVIASLLVCLVAAGAVYFGTYYKAQNVEASLSGDSAVQVSRIDSGYFFDGQGTQSALIFYPGAKVACEAYAPLMHELADRGIDCFLVEMPLNFAIFDVNRAQTIMHSYTYEKWLLAGHSLGGAMAAEFAAEHKEELAGLCLLAAYSTKDLSDADFPLAVIYGSEDTVVNKEKIEAGRALAPADYREIEISGGNHAGFASYGAQSGDGKATISEEQQRAQTVAAILALLK
ncbi:MAG: alpha/beta hydrolase [Clostridia bacterium]|nr:alpha/beta hydrolase [Clostridia bacterium]